MASSELLIFSDQTITGHTFKHADLSEAKFRRAVLIDCTFECCDMRFADFLKATLIRCQFVDCKWERPEFTGATLKDCNIDVVDGRLGQLGYVAVLTEKGLQVGCTGFTWDLASNMEQRDLLKMDKRNAVNWWARFGNRLLEAGRARKWV